MRGVLGFCDCLGTHNLTTPRWLVRFEERMAGNMWKCWDKPPTCHVGTLM